MISDANMYAEVFEILGCMNKQEVMRIPVNIIEYIKKEKSKNYITRIDKNDLFNPENIDQRSINLLTWLISNYMGSEEEKKEIIRIGKENDKKIEETKKTIYSTNVFNPKEETEKNISESTKDIGLTVINESNSIFTKVVKFLQKLFKKDK